MECNGNCAQGADLPLDVLLERSIAKLGPGKMKLTIGVLHARADDKCLKTLFRDKDTCCLAEHAFAGAVDQDTVDRTLVCEIRRANARLRARAVAERLDREGQTVFIEGGRNAPWFGLFCWVRLEQRRWEQRRWISVTVCHDGISVKTPFCRKVIPDGSNEELHHALVSMIADANAALGDAETLAPQWAPSTRF